MLHCRLVPFLSVNHRAIFHNVSHYLARSPWYASFFPTPTASSHGVVIRIKKLYALFFLDFLLLYISMMAGILYVLPVKTCGRYEGEKVTKIVFDIKKKVEKFIDGGVKGENCLSLPFVPTREQSLFFYLQFFPAT